MIEVGQELFVTGGFYKSVGWKRIEKIGKVYFTFENDRGRFYISNLREDSKTNYPRQCYLTDTEYFERLELDKLTSAIKDRVIWKPLNLGQAQAIAAILGINMEESK
jgi:predicted transcriptional regulator